MTTIFISYARNDDERFVNRLHDDLTARGFEVWWDRISMPNRGLTFLQEIRDAIDSRDRFLIVIGPQAVVSDYVEVEWRYALEVGKAITPILRIGDFSLVPEELRLFDVPDFRTDIDYKIRLERLTSQLLDPVSPMGGLISVPSLPPHYLPHSNLFHTLKDAIMADLRRPVVITGAVARTGIHGMGGIGKTVLAIAVARDHEVRRAFSDGVVWLPFGQSPSLLVLQKLIARAFSDPGDFDDLHQGKGRLGQILADRAVCLILDDVWDVQHVKAFDVLGTRCRMLITTRDAAIITALGGTQHQVQLLSDERSLALLGRWADCPVQELPQDAHLVMSECGQLPLSLSICGAMVRDGTRWSDLLKALHEARLDFIKHPHGNVFQSIKVSVDTLTDDQARWFAELSVFPEDATVPESVVEVLWCHEDSMDAFEVRRHLTVLARRSLVRLDTEATEKGYEPLRLVSMHDLVHDYAKGLGGEQKALHSRLVDAYSSRCPNGWSTGPDDGYFFRYLPAHLWEAGRWEEVMALARDKAFLQAQVTGFRGSPTWPLVTKQFALKASGETHDPVAIAEFLTEIAHSIDQTLFQTPLEALRVGNLKRAWELADLFEIQVCALWHLLLIWELWDADRPHEARATWERLTSKKLPQLWSEWHRYGAALMAQIIDVNPKNYINLALQLLDDMNGRRRLCGRLIDAGRLVEAEQLGRSIENPPTKAKIMARVAVAQAQDGQETSARESLTIAVQAARSSVRGNRDEALLSVALAQVRVRKFHDAQTTARMMDANFRRKEVQQAIAKVRAGQLTPEPQKRGVMPFSDWPESSYSGVPRLTELSSRAREGDIRGARQVFSKVMEQVRNLENEIFRTLIMMRVGDEMACAGDQPSARTALEEASRTAVVMSDSRPWPLGVAELQILAGEYADARTTYAAFFGHASKSKCNHREETLKSIMKIQTDAHAFEEALLTARQLTNAGDRTDALGAIAKAQLDTGHIVDARTTTIEACRSALQIELDWRQRANRNVLLRTLEQSDLEGAAEVAKVIGHDSAGDRAFKWTLQRRILTEDFSAAVELAQKHEQVGKRLAALSKVALAAASAGMIEHAEETAKVMSSYDDYRTEHSKVLVAIGTAWAKAGQFEAAITTTRRIKWTLDRAMALAEIASIQRKAGSGKALQTLREAVSLVRDKDGSSAKVKVAAELVESGDVHAAVELVRSIQDIGEFQTRASALSGVALTLARAGSFAEAVSLAVEAESARTLIKITEIQAVTGTTTGIVATLAKAREVAEHTNWPELVKTLCEVAVAQVRAEDAEGARLTFAVVVKMAANKSDDYRQSKAIEPVIEAQVTIGDFVGALETVALVRSPYYRTEHLTNIAVRQAKSGDALAARKTFEAARAVLMDKANNVGIDRFQQLVHAQGTVGFFDGALELALLHRPGRGQVELLVALGLRVAGGYMKDSDGDGLQQAGPPIGGILERIFSNATQAALEIENVNDRNTALAQVAIGQARTGRVEGAMASLDTFLFTEKNSPALKIARIFAQQGEYEHFNRLLLPCSWTLEQALGMCSLVAYLYPEHAAAIARIVAHSETREL